MFHRMIIRALKSKETLFLLFIVILMIVSVIYFYIYHVQENLNNVIWSGERCMSELSSVKYQLNEVTEYKKHLDKLLTEKFNAHEDEKVKFNDLMENCIAMQQQSTICQNQFEDLQSECKKVKQDYDKVKEKLQQLTLDKQLIKKINK